MRVVHDIRERLYGQTPYSSKLVKLGWYSNAGFVTQDEIEPALKTLERRWFEAHHQIEPLNELEKLAILFLLESARMRRSSDGRSEPATPLPGGKDPTPDTSVR